MMMMMMMMVVMVIMMVNVCDDDCYLVMKVILAKEVMSCDVSAVAMFTYVSRQIPNEKMKKKILQRKRLRRVSIFFSSANLERQWSSFSTVVDRIRIGGELMMPAGSRNKASFRDLRQALAPICPYKENQWSFSHSFCISLCDQIVFLYFLCILYPKSKNVLFPPMSLKKPTLNHYWCLLLI